MFAWLIAMKLIVFTRNLSPKAQLIAGVLSVLITAITGYFLTTFIGYKAIALILLMLVSVLAVLFDIIPVLVCALLSAFIWNFFFIPPVFTLHIDNAEDLLLFVMYFVIALVNAVLSSKIRQAERITREKEEKEKAILLYNTLLNSLSHELRTPIAAILGSADTLNNHRQNLSAEQTNILLEEIEKAGLRLNQQVENLLNVSRLESGMLKTKTDWCDLRDLIPSVIAKVKPEAKQQFDFITGPNLPLVRIDRGLMEQVFFNLFSNAVHYTPEGTMVKIHASVTEDVLLVKVSDNGLGFPIGEMEKAFDKFYRIPQSKAGGSGLGLSIVKGFIEAHGGSVVLHNANEGGAVFDIRIPVETNYINQLKHE